VFYTQSGIWVPHQVAVESLLKAHPDDVYIRSHYARVACIAERFSIAKAQFEKLDGKYEPRFFPGKGEFERFAEIANAVPIKAEQLVGKWSHANGAVVLEFDKSGELKMISKLSGKMETADGIFKVEGTKLSMLTSKRNKIVTVVKLTDDVLAVTSTDG